MEVRRRKYETTLRQPDAFALIAQRSGEAVGYALVGFADGPAGWDYGEREADVETLAVAAHVRDRASAPG